MIASVILFINEVELSIYRFLSSGVKNSKREPWPCRARGRPVHWPLEHLMLDRLPLPRLDLDQERVNSNWEEEATG